MATCIKYHSDALQHVSIHATLAGGDLAPAHIVIAIDVSIHATLAGGDRVIFPVDTNKFWFLSTPPSRVATRRHSSRWQGSSCFYPRHPRGWRPFNSNCLLCHDTVSIHATLAGGDFQRRASLSVAKSFLSTPPSRVATHNLDPAHCNVWRFYPRHPRGWRRPLLLAGWLAAFVSIHATLAGGDIVILPRGELNFSFYPRHPRGWRPMAAPVHAPVRVFLSTPPSRVATE